MNCSSISCSFDAVPVIVMFPIFPYFMAVGGLLLLKMKKAGNFESSIVFVYNTKWYSTS